MPAKFTPDLAVGILREVIVALVRKDGPALSTHQLGVFLTCYLKDGDHTVRGLAAELHVSKSVITRALDKLGELDLAQRRPDPTDRRSVLVDRTGPGRALIDELKAISAASPRRRRRETNCALGPPSRLRTGFRARDDAAAERAVLCWPACDHEGPPHGPPVHPHHLPLGHRPQPHRR